MSQPYSQSYTPILACLKGNLMASTVDLLTDSNYYLPQWRGVSKITIGNLDYNERRNTTVQFTTANGYAIEGLFLTDTFRPIVSKSKNDAVSYCDYPVVHQINRIDVKIGNVGVEALYPQTILNRLKERFKDNFQYIAETWLGGAAEYNSKNQRYEGFEGTNYSSDTQRNVIKPEYKWILPLTPSILMNEDVYKFSLGRLSCMDFQIIFNSIRNITNRSMDIIPDEVSGSLEVWHVYVRPNDEQYFNGLTYLKADRFLSSNPTKSDYYFNDFYYEVSDKKLQTNQEFRIPIKTGPCVNAKVYITNPLFSNSFKFYGISVKKAAENYIGSHITNSIALAGVNSNIIDLAAGVFYNSDSTKTPSRVSSSWSIMNHNPEGNSFDLVYTKNVSTRYTIKITCSSNWNTLDKLYMDLDTFVLDSALSAPKLYYFKTFNLDIRPFEANTTNYLVSEDKSVTVNGANRLIKGFFSYCPVNGNNTLAFWGVSNIIPSDMVSEELYNFSFSLPVTNASNNANIFATKRQVYINYPNWQFHDLDKKMKITVNNIDWGTNNRSAGLIQMNSTDLELFRPYYKKLEWDSPQAEFVFSYVDWQNNKNSKGFYMLQEGDMEIKLNNVDLIFDNMAITDVSKEKQAMSHQYMFSILFFMIRQMKYTDNIITVLGDSDKLQLNINISNTILKDQGLYVSQTNEEDNVQERSAPKIIKTSNGAIVQDTTSMNNKYLEPSMYDRRAFPGSIGEIRPSVMEPLSISGRGVNSRW